MRGAIVNMHKMFILLLSAIVLLSGCDNSKITESDLPSNQKILSLCITPWEQSISEGAKVISYLSDTAACNEGCKSVEFKCTGGRFFPGPNVKAGTTIADTKQSCKQETRCGCQLPDDKGRVSDGFTTKVFSTSQVACGQACSSVEQTVICKNGKFFENADQTKEVTNYNFSCSIEDCKSCSAPWDGNLRAIHGGRLIGYVKDSLTCGFSCSDTASNAIGFTCANGELRRDTGALTTAAVSLKTTCQVSTDCACKTATGETFIHDKVTKFKLFKKSTGTCNVACDAGIDYTCEEGKFINKTSGATETAPLYLGCTDTCKYCTLPNGQTVKQGTVKILFKTNEGTCSQACKPIELRCDAGATTGEIKIVSGTGPITDYKESSCSDTCVTCDLPDGTKLIENAERDLFKKTTAGCGETCEKVVVKCDKATRALIKLSGAGSLSDYKSMTCRDTCVQCTMPDGSKINAPAYNEKRFGASTVACGQSCDSQMEYLHCNTNGTVTKSGNRTSLQISELIHTGCSMEPCKDCAMPWKSDGSKLTNGNTATVYPAATVVCGQRCESTAIELRCTDSNLVFLSGNSQTNLSTVVTSCANAVCPVCRYNGRDYREGEKMVAYKNNGSSCTTGACSDNKTFTCSSGQWQAEGALITDYPFGSCVSQCATTEKVETGRLPGDTSAEGGGAFTWMCPVLHSRGFAWNQTKLSYYTKSRVACGDSCNNYRVEVECNSESGLFTNSAQMLYLNCVDACQ